MKVGIISVQGDVSEHVEAAKRGALTFGTNADVVCIRRNEGLEGLDALIIPGGESTTISKLLIDFGLMDAIVEMAEEGVPIMGTCAGCVLLAKKGDEEVERTGTRLLGLMDMEVERNAFGRQKESFEAALDIDGLDKSYPGVFIRAPSIKKVWGDCEILASLGDNVVMAAQDNLLAVAFHPELTRDTRVHEMFFDM